MTSRKLIKIACTGVAIPKMQQYEIRHVAAQYSEKGFRIDLSQSKPLIWANQSPTIWKRAWVQ